MKKKRPDYNHSQIAHIIDEYVHSERDRNILKRKLIDGIGFEQLADEFDMSVRGVKYIVYRQEKRIFAHL